MAWDDKENTDAVGKMCFKLKWMARHLKYGKLEIAGELQVHNGIITQSDVKIVPVERFRGDCEH